MGGSKELRTWATAGSCACRQQPKAVHREVLSKGILCALPIFSIKNAKIETSKAILCDCDPPPPTINHQISRVFKHGMAWYDLLRPLDCDPCNLIC